MTESDREDDAPPMPARAEPDEPQTSVHEQPVQPEPERKPNVDPEAA